MNNLRAAEFEDAGNNLVQIKCDIMSHQWSRYLGAVEMGAGDVRAIIKIFYNHLILRIF